MHSYSKKKTIQFDCTSLNPCFNGRCTRTLTYGKKAQYEFVLILVLMEDALVRR